VSGGAMAWGSPILRDVKVEHGLGIAGCRCDDDAGEVAVIVEGDQQVDANEQIAVGVPPVASGGHRGAYDAPPGGVGHRSGSRASKSRYPTAAVPSSRSGTGPRCGSTATMKSEVWTAHGAVPSPSTVDALRVQTLVPHVTVSAARPLASTAMSWVRSSPAPRRPRRWYRRPSARRAGTDSARWRAPRPCRPSRPVTVDTGPR
jgi:hypothetical protein